MYNTGEKENCMIYTLGLIESLLSTVHFAHTHIYQFIYPSTFPTVRSLQFS